VFYHIVLVNKDYQYIGWYGWHKNWANCKQRTETTDRIWWGRRQTRKGTDEPITNDDDDDDGTFTVDIRKT